MFWNIVKGATALVIVLGLFFGVYKYIDARYALAEELNLVKKSLAYKISDDQRISMQKEKREIEERNLGKPIEKWSVEDRSRYGQIKDDLDNVLSRIRELVK